MQRKPSTTIHSTYELRKILLNYTDDDNDDDDDDGDADGDDGEDDDVAAGVAFTGGNGVE